MGMTIEGVRPPRHDGTRIVVSEFEQRDIDPSAHSFRSHQFLVIDEATLGIDVCVGDALKRGKHDRFGVGLGLAERLEFVG